MFQVSTYTRSFSWSLPESLRDELGGWWEDPLSTPSDGMDVLPKAFMQPNKVGWNYDVELSSDVIYGFSVDTVTEEEKSVMVSGMNRTTNQNMTFTGDAVILTCPLQILRQLDVNLPIDKQKAIANITYEASTKVILQCKNRFWQPDVGQGGFSKTNLPIGQVHYPDWAGSGYDEADRGILVVYTWKHDALMFGSQPKEQAIASAVKQLSHLHPEIEKEFEVGEVEAWYNDPYAQGAYAALEPFEYMKAMRTLVTPTARMYLAGEALSWSNGWIQGALFSGLIQAFAFTFHNESGSTFKPCEIALPVGTVTNGKVDALVDHYEQLNEVQVEGDRNES